MDIQPYYPGSAKHPNILTSTVPISEEHSLRHIIRTRFADHGMPENSIAFILREILKGLSYLHLTLNTDHNDINSGQIYVRTDQFLTSVQVVLHPGKNFVHPFPAWKQRRTPNEGIWGAGIIALELAYGSLPRNCTGLEHLVSMAKNMIRVLKLKLDINGDDDDDQKEKEKAPKDERKLKLMGNAEDQKREEKTEDKGKEIKLENVDDQKQRLKAEDKGKKKLEDVYDDIDERGKEKAKQTGKETTLENVNDQIWKEMAAKKGTKIHKLIIKMPVLEKLLDDGYVEELEKKLIKEKKDREKKKKAMVVLQEKYKKAVMFFKKNNDGEIQREFSRDFLEVVMMCLDAEEQNPIPAKRILDHPFFKIDLRKFERSMR